MAIFSGKIIEATYTNEKKDTIEILYKEEKKIVPYYIEVNHQHPDFQDLIKEYSLYSFYFIMSMTIETS